MRMITIRPKLGVGRSCRVLVEHAPVAPFRADRTHHQGRPIEAQPLAAELGRMSGLTSFRFPCALLPSALGRVGS